MASATPVSPSTALGEALSLGGVIGLLHAVCETTLLGWYGIRPTLLDFVILTVTPVMVAAIGALAALLVVSGLLRKPSPKWSGRLTSRWLLWTLVAGAYVLVFLKVVSYSSGRLAALKLLAIVTPVFAAAWVAVFRRGGRALVVVWASLSVAAAACFLQLADAGWDYIPEGKRATSALELLLCMAVCLAVLAWLVKATPADGPFQPMLQSAEALATVAVLWVGLWWAAFSQPSLTLVKDEAQRDGPRPSGPNFVLVVLDTVRADHLDLFGYERETMPNLRRFALEESQAVIRMTTTAPWTVPSHASMFTGLYPSAHGAHFPFATDTSGDSYAYSLRNDVPTLAEFLTEGGYRTAGIGANFSMLTRFGLPRGFAYHDILPGSLHLARDIAWFYRFGIGAAPTPGDIVTSLLPAALQRHSVIFSSWEPRYRRAREITSRAEYWLERNGRSPFFLFMNYLDAHSPFVPPADDEKFAPRPPGAEWSGFPGARYDAFIRGHGEFTAPEKEFLKGLYDAELLCLDRELGRLLDYLKQGGFFENTLVFVTSDHGESLFEHDLLGHGNALYQTEIGGFLVVKSPPSLGKIEPSPSMQPVDFFPTIAAIAGEPIPSHIQGSVWGKGRDYTLAELFCKSCGRETAGYPRHELYRRELISVTIGQRKLIRSTNGPDEVYDLQNDVAELNPTAEGDAEFRRRVEEVIAERNSRLVEKTTEKEPADKRLLEQLRGLGYIK